MAWLLQCFTWNRTNHHLSHDTWNSWEKPRNSRRPTLRGLRISHDSRVQSHAAHAMAFFTCSQGHLRLRRAIGALVCHTDSHWYRQNRQTSTSWDWTLPLLAAKSKRRMSKSRSCGSTGDFLIPVLRQKSGSWPVCIEEKRVCLKIIATTQEIGWNIWSSWTFRDPWYGPGAEAKKLPLPRKSWSTFRWVWDTSKPDAMYGGPWTATHTS